MSMNDCPYDIFGTFSEHFVTKLGMMMRHYEPECHAVKLVRSLSEQGHSEG